MTEAWAQTAWAVLQERGLLEATAAEEDPAGQIAAGVAAGRLRMEAIVGLLAETYALSVVTAFPSDWTEEERALVEPALARQRQVLPLGFKDGVLALAIADPLDLETVDLMAHRAGCAVDPRLAAPEALAAAIERYGGGDAGAGQDEDAPVGPTAATTESASPDLAIDGLAGADPEAEGPIIRLVQRIIAEAIRQRASDIHLEPGARRLRLRFRVDGRLREIESPPKPLQEAVISRLKLMAQLSLAEKRRPQDGRIRVRASGKELDFRVSSLPSAFGETLVMRILDKEGLRLGLSELGMWSDDEAAFSDLIGQPDGLVLVTGPTGSGKSTTLYAALHHLNQPDRKIITVEDPVEYRVAGINQVAVRREVGLDFAAALRAMLRQAPNIIMVGEIRDRETSEIAINASLTGHLVFSTLHTNDAPSAVPRLVDLGTKPFLVASALRGVLAQRLVRMICAECRESSHPGEAALAALGLRTGELPGGALPRGSGCLRCGGSGYHGRRGLFELLPISEPMERLIYERATLVELRRQAREGGMRTMREDGRRKVLAGWTTIDEVLAVTVSD
ncbi:MAG: GspE/PulE family protein [Verrucomicrobiota bacterium]